MKPSPPSQLSPGAGVLPPPLSRPASPYSSPSSSPLASPIPVPPRAPLPVFALHEPRVVVAVSVVFLGLTCYFVNHFAFCSQRGAPPPPPVPALPKGAVSAVVWSDALLRLILLLLLLSLQVQSDGFLSERTWKEKRVKERKWHFKTKVSHNDQRLT